MKSAAAKFLLLTSIFMLSSDNAPGQKKTTTPGAPTSANQNQSGPKITTYDLNTPQGSAAYAKSANMEAQGTYFQIKGDPAFQLKAIEALRGMRNPQMNGREITVFTASASTNEIVIRIRKPASYARAQLNGTGIEKDLVAAALATDRKTQGTHHYTKGAEKSDYLSVASNAINASEGENTIYGVVMPKGDFALQVEIYNAIEEISKDPRGANMNFEYFYYQPTGQKEETPGIHAMVTDNSNGQHSHKLILMPFNGDAESFKAMVLAHRAEVTQQTGSKPTAFEIK